jgi:hypothetical protein
MKNYSPLPQFLYAAFLFVASAAVSAADATRHPISVTDLLQMQRVADVQISPDGAWVAYTVAAQLPLLVITSDDRVAGDSVELLKVVRASGGKRITEKHFATDHVFSDARIALESTVIEWLQTLK